MATVDHLKETQLVPSKRPQFLRFLQYAIHKWVSSQYDALDGLLKYSFVI